MIKIERGAYPTGSIMDKKKTEELEKLRDLSAKRQTLKFNRLWSGVVKSFLHQSQHGKCCYCERRRDQKGEPDVEHFRPKAKLKENPKHSGYWWLAYDWNNLLISCKKCNNRKGANFPLKDESKRAFSENDDLKKEDPILINPLTENPEDFIEYDIPKDFIEYDISEDDGKTLMIKAIGKCERGDKTVNELTGINDRELLMERAEYIENYHSLTECFHLVKNNLKKKTIICKKIKKKMQSESKFAGLARFYFSQVRLSDI